MKGWALLIAGVLFPYLFTSVLQVSVATALLLPVLLLALRPKYRLWCLFPLSVLLTSLAIGQRLTQRLPDTVKQTEHSISGRISSLPAVTGESVRFIFQPDVASSGIPSKIKVSWYKARNKEPAPNLPEIHAGERWQLQLQLRTTRSRVNFNGSDTERWLFAQGIGATAFVRPGVNIRLARPNSFNLQHIRESVFQKLHAVAPNTPAIRLIIALAIADRRGLQTTDKDIFSATGTGHLLAISGLHIGLAASMGFYLGKYATFCLPLMLQLRLAIALPWLLAWLAALSYAALSGFGVSTQRALIMLSVATVVVLSRRKVQPLLPWLIAMGLVLVADPFAPLRAGFWFSFAAVAVLLLLFIPRTGSMPAWRIMLMAQMGISLTMAPLGMYWFQQASLPGLLANLVAIPVVSFIVVPAILLALLLLWLPGPLAAWLLSTAGYVIQALLKFLESLSALQPEILRATHTPGLWVTMLAMCGAAMLLLPRGVTGRYAGLLLLLPLLLTDTNRLAEGEVQTDLLDVGQGLSVLVGDRDYLMVYDTGPGNGLLGEAGWDMVRGTIKPMIAARGLAPDLIVASHADMDHAGGLNRLRDIYPQARYLASLRHLQKGIQACSTPSVWMGGNLSFRVLHPSIGLPYLGNDSSCVISVKAPGFSLLLSGDISRVVEQRLVDAGLAPHDLLTAPHHGSASSSSHQLIAAVAPAMVLISAGANNRFGFPKDDVLKRYTNAGVAVLNTAQCGGVRILGNPGGISDIQSARNTNNAIWRWPAGPGCP